MIKRYFPPVRETVLLVVITLAFLLLTATCIGLRTEHFLMTGLFLVLFFAGKTTRKLAVALLPFVVFAVSYDWMRVYPNYQVNPIDVQGLYEAEKSLFGISVNGDTLIPCEYFVFYSSIIFNSKYYIVILLGACAYSFRFVALSEGRSPDVSPFCYGLPAG